MTFPLPDPRDACPVCNRPSRLYPDGMLHCQDCGWLRVGTDPRDAERPRGEAYETSVQKLCDAANAFVSAKDARPRRLFYYARRNLEWAALDHARHLGQDHSTARDVDVARLLAIKAAAQRLLFTFADHEGLCRICDESADTLLQALGASDDH